MAVSNSNGHGITNFAGAHNMDTRSADINFPQAPQATTQRQSASGGKAAGGVTDAGAYASRSSAKKKATNFPPAK